MQTGLRRFTVSGWCLAFLVGVAMPVQPVSAEDLDIEQLFELDIEALFEVTISTASKMDQTVDVAPATVYVVTEEQIRRLGLRDLKDILAIVPGVDTMNPHFFLLGGQRGFVGSFSQTLLMINGREVNNLIAGETFISNQFRSHNIKQVEIISGPGSALYGANALAGVINIITKTADDFQGIDVSVARGMWGTSEVNVFFADQKGDLKVHGSASLYRSSGEDYASYLSNTVVASPRAENNAYRHLPDTYGYRNDAQAIPLSLHLENKGLYAGMEYYRNEIGRGTSGIEWDYNQGEDVREFWMGYVGYERENLWDDRMDAKVEYRYYWEQFWGNNTEGEGPLENPFTGEMRTFDATRTDVEAYRGFYSNRRMEDSEKHVANLETRLRLNPKNTLILGFNFEYSDIVGAAWSRTEGPHPVSREDQIRPAFSNYKWGLYAQHEVRLWSDRLGLTLGLRFDEHEIYGDTLNPRGGLVYRATDSTILKLLYGEAFREPTVFELQNNQNIKPSTMQTIELGWHQYLGRHLKNEAVAFFNMVDDLIVSDSTELGGISNRGELEAYGFENQLNVSLGNVRGFANYTYTTAELDEPMREKRKVADIPKHKANLGMMIGFGERYSIGPLLRYRGRTPTEYRDERLEVSDYVVLDVAFNVVEIPWFDSSARLDIIAKNVFDKEYFHAEPRAPAVVKHPQEGRYVEVRFGIRI